MAFLGHIFLWKKLTLDNPTPSITRQFRPVPRGVVLSRAAIYHNTYWRRRGIPGPPSSPFFGNIKDWWEYQGYGFKLREWTNLYGKVYGIQEGWKNILIVSDLDMLQELFTKKFEHFHTRKLAPSNGNVDTEPRVNIFGARGARWKRLRAIANPVFSVNNLKKVMPIIEDSVHAFLGFMDKVAEASEEIDIRVYFHELTMDIICRIALGQKSSRQFNNKYTAVAQQAFARIGRSKIMRLSWMFPWLGGGLRRITMLVGRLKKDPILEFFKQIDLEVKRRKELRNSQNFDSDDSKPKRETVDFIDLFLDAESDEVVNLVQANTFNKAATKVDKKLTPDEITAQCILFLLAGFETTANSLANTCYNLMNNPQCQKRLQDEIDEFCPEQPSYEQLSQMKYLDAIIRETLRLHPTGAAFACARTCTETTTLGKYTVESGTIVQADAFTIHYDSEIWGSDAEQFKPERWLESTNDRHPLAWFPFGSGPRNCIGFRLAYLEEKLALVHLFRKYTVLNCPQPENRPNHRGANREQVIVKLKRRERSNY
ncbi:cytochrome p450 domain-containing protein [Ditylenchus destructor]|nr:cytochrome p450 domain-containing protein [Ditylenchus destructor]